MITDDYIETFTGTKFYVAKPDRNSVQYMDIAHSLAMQCRYTGHCKRFYSVAEHSILVATLLKPEHKLWGLLHDGSEAYLTDVASPVKQHLPEYKAIEKRLQKVIYESFGLYGSVPYEVKEADKLALAIEAKQLMLSEGKDWKVHDELTQELPDVEELGLEPIRAKDEYLKYLSFLTQGKYNN